MNLRIYKYLAYSLPILFLHAACSSEDNIGNERDRFGSNDIVFAAPAITMDVPVTRATLMNSITENTVFGVLGYCVPYQLNSETNRDWRGGASEWLTKKNLVSADVMYCEPIFYDGSKCVYSADGSKFNSPKEWYTAQTAGGVDNTDQFLYSFIAYHPYSSGFAVAPGNDSTRGIPKLTYTMPYAAGNDVNAELDSELAKDVMIAAVFDHAPTQGAVQLEFKHLLTGLRLQINNYNQPVNNEPNTNAVIIHSLSINGHFYRVGEVDFAPADPTLAVTDEMYSGTFHFIKETDTDDFTVAPNSAAIVGATPDNPQGNTLLLLPKLDAQAGGATSAVPYLGTDKNITITYSYSGQPRKTAQIRNFSLGRIPEQGTCYTINLNFIGNQLLLMFTADDIEYWENGSDNDIIIN